MVKLVLAFGLSDVKWLALVDVDDGSL